MLLRGYSLCVLMIDTVWVVLNAIYAVMQAVYEVFRPPPLKSVENETALVSFLFFNVYRLAPIWITHQTWSREDSYYLINIVMLIDKLIKEQQYKDNRYINLALHNIRKLKTIDDSNCS